MEQHGSETGHGSKHSRAPYRKFLLMLGLHFAVMYLVMYAMVDTFGNVIFNLNQFYMTAMMVAPMAFTMLLLMPSMYPSKSINYAFYAVSAVAFLLSFIFLRAQIYIEDRQFLKSMIPHHAGAVLMCERATIYDSEIAQLCAQIVESQQREIAQMKRILERL